MADTGTYISGQRSKVLTQYPGKPFDYVITGCNHANESYPVFPGAKNWLHWSFPDPSKATGTEEQQLDVYRNVRDSIAARIKAELL